jgi:hypothetical protein
MSEVMFGEKTIYFHSRRATPLPARINTKAAWGSRFELQYAFLHGGSGFNPWGCVVVGGKWQSQNRLGRWYRKLTAKMIHTCSILNFSPLQSGAHSRPGGAALTSQHAINRHQRRQQSGLLWVSSQKEHILDDYKGSVELTEDLDRASGQASMTPKRKHVEGRGTMLWMTRALLFLQNRPAVG